MEEKKTCKLEILVEDKNHEFTFNFDVLNEEQVHLYKRELDLSSNDDVYIEAFLSPKNENKIEKIKSNDIKKYLKALKKDVTLNNNTVSSFHFKIAEISEKLNFLINLDRELKNALQ